MCYHHHHHHHVFPVDQHNSTAGKEVFRKIPSNVPSSPPGMEKSRGSIDHFCMCWACDTAFSLTRSMLCWMASSTAASSRASDTVVARLPTRWHQETDTGDSLSVGIDFASTSVWYNNNNNNNSRWSCCCYYYYSGFIQTFKHCFPGLSRTFKDQIPWFSRTQKCVFKDFPGYTRFKNTVAWGQKVHNQISFRCNCITVNSI